MNRICVYTKDVQLITGKSDKTSRIILNQIRKHLKKEKHHQVTVTELCNYLNLDVEEVRKILK